ncbi:MAG TPA: hypothetical protein VMU29_12180 [Smithella sp.]|nr:hypothetical protein [Smithella sp.]
MNEQTKTELEEQKEHARKFLLKHLKPGKEVYTIVRKVSNSRMSREISLYITIKNKIVDIGWYVSKVTGHKMNEGTHAIKIGGCGMDMGFALVYNLGRALYPKGFKLPKGKNGRNGDTSGFDKDGGYALTQRWM